MFEEKKLRIKEHENPYGLISQKVVQKMVNLEKKKRRWQFSKWEKSFGGQNEEREREMK